MKVFQLNWTAPSNNGGSAITDYAIQYSTDGQTWTTYSDGISSLTEAIVTVPAEQECQSFQFKVAAVNSAGTGLYCPPVSAVLGFVPNSVTDLSVNLTGLDDVQLTWTAPTNNGCPVTDYAIQYSNNAGSSWNTISDGVGTGTSVNINDLPWGTYLFKVAAVNVVGTGNYVEYGSPIYVTTTTTTTTTAAPTTTTAAPTTTTAEPTTTTAAPGVAGFIVSGAGSPVNDTYCYYDVYNGQPRYKAANIQWYGFADLFIFYSGSWWIGNDDVAAWLYNSDALNASELTTSNWYVDLYGDPNPPSVSQTTC